MSAAPLRHRQAVRRHQPIERIGRIKVNDRDWRAPPQLHTVRTPPALPPRASWWDRFAAAGWRLHDGMAAVWALMGAVVLIAGSGAGVALLAMLFGWQP
jgi:hypothetical protein